LLLVLALAGLGRALVPKACNPYPLWVK